MTFNPGVPESNQTIASSQDPIKTNFELIDTAFNNSTANFSQYLFSNVCTQPAITNPNSVIFTKTAYGYPFLYFKNAFGLQQLTGINNVAPSGYTQVQGSLIIQWSSDTGDTTGTAITFPIAYTTACYAVVATQQGNQARAIAVNGLSKTGFTVYTTNNGATFYYIALGF